MPNGMLAKTFKNADGSLNFNNIGSLVDIIGSFGSLWSAFQQNKLAKEALNFQKDAYNTNLTNQIASYNTAIGDRANARSVAYDNPGYADRYYNDNKLTR